MSLYGWRRQQLTSDDKSIMTSLRLVVYRQIMMYDDESDWPHDMENVVA